MLSGRAADVVVTSSAPILMVCNMLDDVSTMNTASVSSADASEATRRLSVDDESASEVKSARATNSGIVAVFEAAAVA